MTDQHNASQQRYFSERTLPRMTLDLADTPYVRRHAAEVGKALGLDEGSEILDLGCGLGKYTLAIRELGYRVEGIDLTAELIEDLRRRLPDVPSHVGDVAEPPEALHARFDGAVGFFFLHHVADLTPIFSGARRTLRPGGRAVFIEPNPWYPGYYAQITFTPGMSWRREIGIFQMRRRPLESAALAAGFTEFSTHAFGAAPPAIANRAWGRHLERLVEGLPFSKHWGAFRTITMA